MFVAAVVCSLCSLITNAQGPDSDYYNDRITNLFVRLVEAENDSAKEELSDSILIILEKYAGENYLFDDHLDGTRYLGQVTSPDSLMKILTWNLVFSDGRNSFNCIVIFANDNNENRIVSMRGNMGLSNLKQDTILREGEWYGALYYDIQPFVYDDTTFYVLLGIDLSNTFTTSKVIEVLDPNSADGLIFGSPRIKSPRGLAGRFLFHYSASVSMLLRFNEKRDMIHFDHLSPSSPQLIGEFQFYGPDFSYDALEYRNGFWYFIEDVDIRNKE